MMMMMMVITHAHTQKKPFRPQKTPFETTKSKISLKPIKPTKKATKRKKNEISTNRFGKISTNLKSKIPLERTFKC